MTGVARPRMVARSREAPGTFGGIVLLKGVAFTRVGGRLADRRRYAGLLRLETFADALGVFVLLVLWHGYAFRCGNAAPWPPFSARKA